MFDRTVINQKSVESVPYEKTIVEKKAPTDESIRLLNEFHDKAKENILDRIIVENNKFNYKAIVYEESHTMQRFISYSFSLNGENFNSKVRLKDKESKYTLIDELIKDLSNEIMRQIVNSDIFK